MLIHNAVITGSLTYNGVDISDITGSEASISALNSFSASMLNYTASNNVASASFSTRVVNLESTASVLTTASASFAIVSQSYASASGSLSTRVTNTETTASSLVTASGSFSTRVTNLELTGSSLVAASASFSTRVVSLESTASVLTTASASFAQQSGSNSTRLTNLESTASVLTTASASFAVVSSSFASTSGSDSRRITNLESTASVLTTASASFAVVSSSYASASGSLSTRVTTIEGSYATTGSNTFTGVQNITNIANAISFTSTGSLYTDGGARITKDLYVSGTSYFNNVTIYGTQSVNYITSSQLNIGTNIINVNTNTPTIRFGGLAVYDSGSTGLTGSILWDSEDNQWIYSNPSGSAYDSAVFLVGPRNVGVLGNEVGITCNFLSKGNGLHHMTSSGIFEDGSRTCFYGNTVIGSGGTVCSTMGNFTCMGVGSPAPAYPLDICGTARSTSNFVVNNGTVVGNFAIETAQVQIGTSLNHPFVIYTCNNERIRVTNTGISCFSCQVCAPAFVGGTVSGTTIYGSTAICGGVICGGATTLTGALTGTSAAFSSTLSSDGNFTVNTNRFTVSAATGNTSVAGTLNVTGQACASSVLSSGTICSTGNTCFGGMSVVASCLGVGTATPNQKLQVYDATVARILVGTNTTFTDPYSGFPAQNISAIQVISSNVGGAQLQLGYTNTCSGCGIGGIHFMTTGTSASEKRGALIASELEASSATNVTANLVFYTNITGTIGERMRIASTGQVCFACTICAPMVLASGCVGIGTTSPYQNLQVYQTGGAGNNYVEGTIQVGGTSSILGAALSYAAQNSGYVNLVNLNTSGGANARISLGFGAISSGLPASTVMTLNQSGYVGIGTCTPTRALDMCGVLRVQTAGSSGAPSIELGVQNQGSGFFAPAANTIAVATNDNERLRITSTGIACFACQVCAPTFLGSTATLATAGTACTVSGVLTLATLQTGGASVCAGAAIVFEGNAGATVARIYSRGNMNFNNGSDLVFQTQVSAGGTPQCTMVINGNTQRVGIGFFTPTYKLHVDGSIGGDMIIASNCIGIGTTSPGYNLEVCGPGRVVHLRGSSASTGVTELGIQGPSMSNTNDTLNLGVGGSTFVNASNNICCLGYVTTGNGLLGLNLRADNGYVIVTTGGTATSNERLRITSTGIACFACQVCAPIFASTNYVQIISSGAYTLIGEGVGVNEYGAIDWDSTNNRLRIATQPYAFGASGGQITLTTGGNVGIGTTSPNYKLEVNGTSCFAGNVAIGGTYCAFALNVHGVTYQIGGSVWVQNGYGYVNSGAVSTGLFPLSDCSIQLRIANSAALTINASNNVGIGTTDPQKPLELRTGGTSTTPSQIFFGGISQVIVGGEAQLAFSSNISPTTGLTTASELTRAGIGFQYISAASPSEFSIGIQCTNVCNSNVRFFNGVERLRITSTGIACFACQVCSGVGFYASSLQSGITIDSTTNGDTIIASRGLSSALHGIVRTVGQNGVTCMQIISTRDSVDGNLPASVNALWGLTNHAMVIATNNAERMRITNAGATVIRPNCIGLSDIADRTLLLGSRPGNADIVSFGFDVGGTWKAGFDFKGSDGQLEWWTNNGSWCRRIMYTPTGIACFSNTICTGGHILPTSNGTQDLGSSSLRWCTVYTSDLSLNNGIGNYTIVEGENDLFLYNNNSCKVYKFVVQEVCPEIAPAKRSI